ncbi:phosphatidylglycerophosphatase A family protein [Maridesulfovibrio zosterae]|uniref:phosphatidylglycerophosphatase A family protein n=1 Tax=Maridesulfovibrio zosterae TaxID=82171 RepID=UPI0004074A54|nr:phosphatidylglycerophosphatase A [Maridesulfovibrio zosterae]
MKNLKINLTKIATLGPVGFLPKAPGTWGSAAAIITAPFLFFPLPIPLRFIVLGLLFYYGAMACSAAEIELGEKDPSSVVIDEVLGQWIVFLPFPGIVSWHVIAGFILFRIFDIFKPWPVRASETWLKSGYGVMIDDVFAGIYAMIGVELLRYLT